VYLTGGFCKHETFSLDRTHIKVALFFLLQNISILVVLLYSWRISVNIKKYSSLEDVYYGEFSICLVSLFVKERLAVARRGRKILNGCFARSLLRFYLTNTAKTNCFLSGCCERTDLNFSLEIYHIVICTLRRRFRSEASRSRSGHLSVRPGLSPDEPN
jgi:hypothetical protein